MSNLLWSRMLLGGLSGILSLTGIAPVAGAETRILDAETLGSQSPHTSDLIGETLAVEPSVLAFELDALETVPSVDHMMGGPFTAIPAETPDRNQPIVIVEPHGETTDDMGVVPSIDQLADVSPTDWAYQALDELIRNWNCIAGYPDGNFRGNRRATRFELAAALNECLNTVNLRFATKAELEELKRLAEEFATELAVLKGQVDQLEARTDVLEDQQFSTTTKLNGEAIMAFSYLGGDNVLTGADITATANPTLNQRTRLNLITSFTGKDRLYTRLQSSNRPVNFSGAGFPAPLGVSGTLDTRLSFDTGNTDNRFILDRLDYKFPVGDKAAITVFASAAFHHYYAATVNPYFEGFGGGKRSGFLLRRTEPPVSHWHRCHWDDCWGGDQL